GKSVVEYLVRLAAGLESMLIGENQIVDQLKNSLAEALSNSSASPLLEDTVHRAISAGASIRDQTGIGRGTVSLGSAAMKLAEETLAKLQDSHVLLLGTGQVGMLVMKALRARGVSSIIVAGRTVQRTRSFCRTFGGTPVEFQTVPSQLASTDLVIVATRSSNYLLTKDSLAHRENSNRRLLFLDLSTPRTVDPNVGELDNVIFKTIDDLRGIADNALAKRRELVRKAEALVTLRVEKITALLQREEAEPIVSDIYRRADQVREEVLRKTLSKLDLTVEQQESLKSMTVSLVEKLLDGPVLNLRRAAERKDERVLTAAGQIFRGEWIPLSFPQLRMRRLRRTPLIRELVREVTVSKADLIQPLFVEEALTKNTPISSMPGQIRFSLSSLVREVIELKDRGVRSILLFGIPSHKDDDGSRACDSEGIVQKSIESLKEQ